MNDNDPIVEAIRDLTRVTVALHGNYASRAEAVRSLGELGISSRSIAEIFDMPTKDVASVLNRAKKAQARTTKTKKTEA